MKFLYFFIFNTSLFASNIFTISDKHGHVERQTTLSHASNAFLEQKTTEYSLQAIYDELHRAQNLARRAEAAHQHTQRILPAKAKKEGKVYHLTQADKKQLLEDAKYYKGGGMYGEVPHPMALTARGMYNIFIKNIISIYPA